MKPKILEAFVNHGGGGSTSRSFNSPVSISVLYCRGLSYFNSSIDILPVNIVVSIGNLSGLK